MERPSLCRLTSTSLIVDHTVYIYRNMYVLIIQLQLDQFIALAEFSELNISLFYTVLQVTASSSQVTV